MGHRSRRLLCLCICFALVAGCGGTSDNASVERDIARGLSEIESVHDRRVLQVRLTRILVALRRDRATSESTRRARALAIRGFTAKLKSIAAEREFAENDSGEVAEATRDAARADAYRVRAETLLRARPQMLLG